jgi:small subunit ribosomal protein S2
VLEGKANASNEVVQAVAAEGDEFVEVSENA